MMRRSRFWLAIVAALSVFGASIIAVTPAWATGNYALRFSGPATPNKNFVTTSGSQFLGKNFTVAADVRWDGTAGYIVAVSRPTQDTSGSGQTGFALGLADGKPFLALATGSNRLGLANTTLTPNVWYSISGSYDGQTIRVYVDGTLDGTQSYGSVANVLNPTSTALIIGREFVSSSDQYLVQRGFHGDIDNVLYSSGTDPAALTTLARYTFSEGSGTLTADSGPSGLTGTLSTNVTPTWVQGADPVTATYVSSLDGVAPVTQSLRPYSSFTLKAANTFTRVGYSLTKWNTGPSTAELTPGVAVTMPPEGVTYYPVWTPTTQSVIFQAGLGTGSPVTRSVTTGAPVVLPAFSSIGFTRAGYHQSGWTLSGVSYSPGTSLTMGASNLTFVADWVADSQIVTYVLNGGVGTAPTQAPVLTDTRIVVAGATTFSRPGFRFVGWTNGGRVNYQPGDSYVVSSRPVQFTAQWQAIPQTVNYNAGIGATGTVPSSISVPTDQRFQVAQHGNLARPGYTFGGWSDQSNPIYPEGAQYLVGPSAVTLSAVWIPDSHIVTYVNSAGSIGTPPTQANVVTDDTFLVADGDDLSLEGYAFSGWTDGSLNESGNLNVYQPGDEYRLGVDDVQLVALWTAIPHEISFLSLNGTTGTVPASFTTVTDDTFTVPSASTSVYPGYSFAGWRDSTGLYSPGSVYTVGSSDVTLVAEWTADPHTVTYSAGTGTGTVPTQSPVTTNSSFTVADASTISRAGFTFAGWSASNGRTYQPQESFTMGTSNVTLTALWIANTYNVRYFLTNGALGTAPAATTAATESTFTTAGSTGFSRSGYSLQGWYDGSTVTNPNSEYMQGVGDTSFYSRWTAQSQTVTYLAGGASGIVPTQSNVDTDSTFALGDTSSLTWPGYTFTGWSDGSSTYAAGYTFTAASAGMTFTATWRANLHHVVFLSGNGATGTPPAAVDVATDASIGFGQPGLTRPGYVFAGWSDGTTTFELTDTFTPDGDAPDLVTLTPVWTAQDHTVTYDLAGGTGTTPSNPDSETDSTFVVAAIGDIEREGFSFGGWSDGTGVYQSGDDYLVGTQDITLSAVWNPVFLSVAYLVGNGATGVPPQQDPIPYNSSLPIASNEGITLDGQYFWGWSDGTTVYQPGSTMTNVRTDVTLTATWGDHPLPTLPNTGRDAATTWTMAFAAALATALGIALVTRGRRRARLDA